MGLSSAEKILLALGLTAGAAAIYGFRRTNVSVGQYLSYNPNVFSKYYTIDDVMRSNTAEQYGLDNTPSDQDLINAAILAQLVLDPLTEKVGAKLIVNSWYRSPAVNAKVGGSSTSDHLDALAADVEDPFGNNLQLAKMVINNDIPFDQMIVYDSIYNPSRIHLSYNIEKAPEDQVRSIQLKNSSGYSTITAASLMSA